ncbi:MAG: ATP-binding protein [Streptosporangiaceae bacterium]
MPTATTTKYTATFHGRADEISRVRHEVARHLADCPATDEAVLVASEFSTNAILHSRSRGGHFTIRIQRHPSRVRVECQDAGGPWRRRHTDDDRPHGLSVVEALTGAAGWGVQVTGDGGRIVWATLTW